MSDQPNEQHRRSLRLQGYDYSQAGAYFITICTQGKACLFGEIENGHMRLNEYGEIVAAEWARSAELRAEIVCGEFVVMPNHFHGIVYIVGAYGNMADGVGAYGNTPIQYDQQQRANGNVDRAYCHTDRAYCHTPLRSPSRNIGAMVRGFKGAVSKKINEIRDTLGTPVLQRNYYEHIIRDDADYNRIVEYINNNPQQWAEDSLHPAYTKN